MRPRYVDCQKWRNRPLRVGARRTGKRNELDNSIIHHADECANHFAELAEMLATLARERVDAYLTRAALIYKGTGDTIREHFAPMIRASEGETRR